jgi:hypothetical protein
LSKASVSDVAANTTTVPWIVPAAEALPAGEALLAAEVLDAAELLDDELHAPSTSPRTATNMAARMLMRRRGRRGPDERPAPLLPLRPADVTVSLMSPPGT